LFLVDWFEARDRRTHPLVRVLKRGGLAPVPNDEGAWNSQVTPRPCQRNIGPWSDGRAMCRQWKS
jgi:hypothetical protein